MAPQSRLLVFNFTMDRLDPLLSHQYEAVSALSGNFEKITVITGTLGDASQNSRIEIISTEWDTGNNFRNVFRLYLKSLPIIVKGNFDSVFFHMTDLQCALLSPFVFLRGKKQVFWYAHTFKSKFLVFSALWVSKIVTSTPGSCPLSGSKVVAIGQAIDEEKFSALPSESLNFSKLIHIGRFDKSKNIQLLICAAQKVRSFFPDLTLTLVGSPANKDSKAWARQLISESELEVRAGWLQFKNSIPRENFPKEVQGNGCFFHAYTGSLDKVLVESTMLRVPVVTINPEYLAAFGTWGDLSHLSLESEYMAMRSLARQDIEYELERRLGIAKTEHSLKHWVKELTLLLRK